jgi:hypothetical protein
LRHIPFIDSITARAAVKAWHKKTSIAETMKVIPISSGFVAGLFFPVLLALLAILLLVHAAIHGASPF